MEEKEGLEILGLCLTVVGCRAQRRLRWWWLICSSEAMEEDEDEIALVVIDEIGRAHV